MYRHEEQDLSVVGRAISSIPVRLYYTYNDNIPHMRSLVDQIVHAVDFLA